MDYYNPVYSSRDVIHKLEKVKKKIELGDEKIHSYYTSKADIDKFYQDLLTKNF